MQLGGIIIALVLAGAIAVLVATVFGASRRAARQLQILRTGRLAKAKILRVHATGAHHDRMRLDLRLRVELEDGESFECESSLKVNATSIPAFQVNAEMPVKFDPANLKEVVVAFKDPTEFALLIAKHDSESVIALIESGTDINMRLIRGYSPLILSIREGDSDLTGALVEKGANLDLQDEDGATALMYAAAAGNLKTVRLLVEHGANVSARTFKNQRTALDNAVGNHRPEIADYLKSKSSE